MDGNFSHYNAYEDYEWNISDSSVSPKVHQSMKALSTILFCLTCFLGVPGNAFVMWIAWFKMKRSVNTIWFCNLAVADLLCCLSIPFSVAEILLDYSWPYGDVMCKILPSVIVLNMHTSVFILTFISLDRFVLVVKPVWAQNHRSLSLAWLCCGGAWALSLVLSLPSMALRREMSDGVFNETICTYHHALNAEGNYEHADPLVLEPLYIVRLVFGLLIPLLVITACYSLIAHRVRMGRFHPGKALRIMIAVVVAFFLCWLPYHVVGLMLLYSEEDVVEILDPVAISLAYVNSCLNPILYVFMGQDFKRRVKLSLQRVFENALTEDVTPSTVQTRGQTSGVTTSSEAQGQNSIA